MAGQEKEKDINYIFLKKFPMGFGCFEEIIFIQETQENLIDFFCLKWMIVKKKYAHYLLMKNIA